ncbi:hypothetical protein OG900_05335 [Streptomyces sp. NBC_00433]
MEPNTGGQFVSLSPTGSGNFAAAGFRDTHGEAFRFLVDLTAGDKRDGQFIVGGHLTSTRAAEGTP